MGKGLRNAEVGMQGGRKQVRAIVGALIAVAILLAFVASSAWIVVTCADPFRSPIHCTTEPAQESAKISSVAGTPHSAQVAESLDTTAKAPYFA